MKKLLIIVLCLLVLFAAIRIGTSIYENITRENNTGYGVKTDAT